jgi:hypothetical protein
MRCASICSPRGPDYGSLTVQFKQSAGAVFDRPPLWKGIIGNISQQNQLQVAVINIQFAASHYAIHEDFLVAVFKINVSRRDHTHVCSGAVCGTAADSDDADSKLPSHWLRNWIDLFENRYVKTPLPGL